MQGLPPRLPGSIVIMSEYVIRTLYVKRHLRAIGNAFPGASASGVPVLSTAATSVAAAGDVLGLLERKCDDASGGVQQHEPARECRKTGEREGRAAATRLFTFYALSEF